MTWMGQLLLFQSLLSVPPLGFVKTPSGLAALHGVGGNFVLGEPLPAEVQGAIRSRSIEVWKLPGEIRVLEGAGHIIPVEGKAFFSVDSESTTLYVWLPQSQELIRWTREGIFRISVAAAATETIAFGWIRPNRLQIFSRSPDGIRIDTLDSRSFLLVDTSIVPEVTHAAVDTKGNRWLASGPALACGWRQWTLDSPVTAVVPLDLGWMLIATESVKWAARCDLESLAALPQSESAQ